MAVVLVNVALPLDLTLRAGAWVGLEEHHHVWLAGVMLDPERKPSERAVRDPVL